MLGRIGVVVLVALLPAAAACGSDDDASRPPSGPSETVTGTSASDAAPGTLQIRPVLELLDAGSPEGLTCEDADAASCVAQHLGGRVVLEASDGRRFRLGPAAFTEDDVERARAVDGAPLGWQVALELTPTATTAFADFTSANEGKQVAMVVYGTVITAPTVEAPITSGNAVVTGFADRAAAVSLADALGGAS